MKNIIYKLLVKIFTVILSVAFFFRSAWEDANDNLA